MLKLFIDINADVGENKQFYQKKVSWLLSLLVPNYKLHAAESFFRS
jgi:hypothetical protein